MIFGQDEIIGTMRTELTFADLSGIKTELLAVLATDTQTGKGPDAKPEPMLLTADAAVNAAAAAVLASGEYKAGANETLLLHAPAGLGGKAALDCGAREAGKGHCACGAQCGGNGGAIHEAARNSGAGICAAGTKYGVAALQPGLCARAAAEGAFVGDYDADTYRSDRKDLSVQSFTLAVGARCREERY